VKKIQILGPGCAKCRQLTEAADAAAKAAGIEYTIEKVTDIREIMRFGVMMTPGLVVDGVVKSVGKVPGAEELGKLIS
jgi:small redox-active disulfide protein 2